MQRYVQQLIEDLQNAKNRPRPPKMELPPELEFVRGAEEYLHGKMYAMGDLFGLIKEQFPPIEKLSKAQIKSIVKNFIELWEAFNFIPDFPEGLPDKVKYKIMVDHLDYKTTVVTVGRNHMGFCTYDPASCPFPDEFCMCKDFELDDEDMNMPDKNENDNDSYF